jgi:hypothetical protein
MAGAGAWLLWYRLVAVVGGGGRLRGLSGAGEEVVLRAARGGGAIRELLVLLLLLGPAVVVLALVRVLVGEVRGVREGERRPLEPLVLGPGPAPAPGSGRRFSGEVIVLRGMCGVASGS